MKMKCILCTLGALVMCTAPVFAQAANKQEKSEFNPHWFMQVQAGASYTLGEGPFGKLVSPAAALSGRISVLARLGAAFRPERLAEQGRMGVCPKPPYQYKYLQGNVEATLDLANLFGRFNPRRTVNPYLFAGVGLNGAFDNDEANALNDSGYRLGNIWSGSKVFVAGRLGLGVNFRLSDCVLFGVEVNANMLSDKYNSKKAGNLDWQFNALGGFTFRFGKNHKKARTAAVVPAPAPTPAPEPAPAPVEEKPAVKETPAPAPAAVAERPAELRENIFFRIGSSQLRTTEEAKVGALVEYLKANPEANVEILGYADAATGSHAVNLKISKLRAESVAAALKKAGIAASRISAEGRGDTAQPFPGVEKNRVSICIAK